MGPLEALKPPALPSEDFTTTFETARLLGMSVRAVQQMVDRGDLEAWKTPGGHRRIVRASVDRWRNSRGAGPVAAAAATAHLVVPNESGRAAMPSLTQRASPAPRVLLIDDSIHFQKLVSLLVRQRFPGVELHVADDGIAGLALYGRLQPLVLIVDILLPGIDGATLITSLRSHPQFARSHLIVVTSLAENQRAPYAFALEQLPVIHKPDLVTELPRQLMQWLPAAARAADGR
ncbi:MAG TPA: response regulator [Burkholderiaceae bacterium]